MQLIMLCALVVPTVLVAALLALRWLLRGDTPGTGGIGASAGGFTLTEMASGLVLLIVVVGLALFAARRGRRLK
jgi:hypothetical protein